MEREEGAIEVGERGRSAGFEGFREVALAEVDDERDGRLPVTAVVATDPLVRSRDRSNEGFLGPGRFNLPLSLSASIVDAVIALGLTVSVESVEDDRAGGRA